MVTQRIGNLASNSCFGLPKRILSSLQGSVANPLHQLLMFGLAEARQSLLQFFPPGAGVPLQQIFKPKRMLVGMLLQPVQDCVGVLLQLSGGFEKPLGCEHWAAAGRRVRPGVQQAEVVGASRTTHDQRCQLSVPVAPKQGEHLPA